MDFQIISGEMLLDFQRKYQVLLIDLRDYESYCQGHLPGALWMNRKHALEEISLLIEHHCSMSGMEPEWIALYCHSGRISLMTARELAHLGYPILSLYGGYEGWKQAHPINCPLEFQHPL